MIRLAVLLALAAVAAAAEVRVDASCPWVDPDGYTPVVVRIQAGAAAEVVELEAELGSASARDRVEIAPGATAVHTLLLPGTDDAYAPPLVRWRSQSSQGQLRAQRLSGNDTGIAVVLDPADRLGLARLNAALSDVPSARWRPSGTDLARRLDAAELPARWQGWPSRLTLLATPEGEAQLDEGQRQAIATWTRTGGALFVTDPASVAWWSRYGARAEAVDAAAPATALRQRLTAINAYAGRDPAAHPVPGTGELPLGWFLTLAIVFAVLAGPVNVWWARRRGAMHLLLLTTPLISVGTCLLLIAIALLADGIGRKRSVQQVVVLDQAGQRAVVFTAATWFCAIAPGAFPLDPDDRLVSRAPRTGGFNARDRRQLALDWRDGGQMADGWIPARVNSQGAITQVRPERRRLALTRLPGGWRLANGLDVAVLELHWRDAEGRLWQCGGIAPGAEADLQPAVTRPEIPGGGWHRHGPDAGLALAGLGTDPETFLGRLAAPLAPIPGPTATDAETPDAWIAGRLGPAATGGR